MKQNMTTRMTVCWVLFFTLFFQSVSFALSCIANGNISPGNNCIATITNATVTTDDPPIPGDYYFVVTAMNGDTIAEGPDIVHADLSNHLGTTIKVQIIDLITNESCITNFFVNDTQPPTLVSCPSAEVFCSASLAPANLPAVIFTDNCQNLTVTFSDSPPLLNCYDPDYIAVIQRTWTATDGTSTPVSCIQTISVIAPNISEVAFPLNIDLDCALNPDASPAVSGQPSIAGNPVGTLCNFTVDYSDNSATSCGGLSIITRTWTVVSECTGEVRSGTQIINFKDTQVPTLTCPGPIVFPTAPGLCKGPATLPNPVVSDNCTAVTVTVNTPGVGAGFDLPNVPKGTHTVIYTAIDACSNFSMCQTTLTITDTETPTAVCTGAKIVALPYPNGMAFLNAVEFNAGSNDNCTGPLSFRIRRMNAGCGTANTFGPTVKFCCADIGNTVTVVLEVSELANPSSSSTCMTQVIVQDKLPPVFTICPGPLTIDCETDYSNLSVFGTPSVFDNCSFTITEDPVININNCGTGTIVRTWVATDPTGNASTCSQTITVQNQTPYDGSTIQWPQDYTLTNACIQPANLLPPNLPSSPINYSAPVTPAPPCAMIATSYTDQVFYISFPACYKIVRTWKVLDWCQYSASNPNVGIWTHQQIIKLMDTQPPVITACPAAVTVGVNNTCTFGVVNIDPVTATDCSPNITITHNSPHATASGANASGNYPPGVHNVTFTVKDGCGNQSTCSTVITVSDLKKPTVKCNTGIVGELGVMAGQMMVTFDATQFNNGSFDNCTSPQNLVFTIREVGDPASPTPSLTYDCDGKGPHQVEIWATDLAGNSDFCITNLIVQDNMVMCPSPIISNFMIAGEIGTEMGYQMPGVNVKIANSSMSGSTNNSGSYVFNDLNAGGNYTVTPEKNADARNGVTTYDLVLMGRHVLGIAPLTSPYKIIAADINNNGAVTTADMVELRKLILYIYNEFPQNKSWRFVDKNYVFPNPANPFSPAYPEVKNMLNINQNMTGADFVGVKIGDLNCSAITSFGDDHTGDRNSGEELTLMIEDREIRAGEEFTVPFKVKNAYDLIAIQFSLEFETDDLELQGFEKGALPGNIDESFGLSLVDEGIVTAGWYHLQPVTAAADAALFSLRFRAKSSGKLSNFLAASPYFTEAMAYDAGEMAMNLNFEYINFNEMNATAVFQLYQNQPNPFKKVTNIGFSLPDAGQAKLTIYDLSGRVLKSYNQVFSKGYNEVSIERNELPSGGVLYYQLETPAQTATKKMILLQ